jgi:hypothetical protein
MRAAAPAIIPIRAPVERPSSLSGSVDGYSIEPFMTTPSYELA